MDFDALIGKTLVGRFRLEAALGKGGFGAVFKATQLSVGRTCAVKILTNVQEGSTDLERFEREARLTSVLDHPNSVVLYDFGHDPEHNVFFIAMEFLDGYSLREAREILGSPLTTDQCLHTLRQAASSLDNAHEAGLVHRDIKPHNIMVVPKPSDPFRVKVIDFGLAKSNSGNGGELSLELTQKDSVIGTPAYMAPEQVLQKTISGKTDQYALGVTAFFMFTHQHIFDAADSAMKIAVQHVSEDPKQISTLTEFGPRTDNVFRRCLAKKPAERFATCTEFVDALAVAIEGDLANPGPAAKPERGAPKTAPAPLAVAPPAAEKSNQRMLLFAFLVFAIGVGSMATVLHYKSQKRKAEGDSLVIAANAPKPVEKSSAPNEPVAPVEKEVAEQVEAQPTEVQKVERQPETPPTAQDPKPPQQNRVVAKPDSTDSRRETSANTSKTVKLPAETKVTKPVPTKDPKPDAKDDSEKAEGKLKVVGLPWGEIYVNGRRASSTSRLSKNVTPGVYRVELKQNGKVKDSARVKIEAGSSRLVKLRAE